jgi:hypothetical protein
MSEIVPIAISRVIRVMDVIAAPLGLWRGWLGVVMYPVSTGFRAG